MNALLDKGLDSSIHLGHQLNVCDTIQSRTLLEIKS